MKPNIASGKSARRARARRGGTRPLSEPRRPKLKVVYFLNDYDSSSATETDTDTDSDTDTDRDPGPDECHIPYFMRPGILQIYRRSNRIREELEPEQPPTPATPQTLLNLTTPPVPLPPPDLTTLLTPTGTLIPTTAQTSPIAPATPSPRARHHRKHPRDKHRARSPRVVTPDPHFPGKSRAKGKGKMAHRRDRELRGCEVSASDGYAGRLGRNYPKLKEVGVAALRDDAYGRRARRVKEERERVDASKREERERGAEERREAVLREAEME
ncbi:hypothetical protein DFH27DRAFT_640946 [Peziza echinospora]|nr:hypothetical protein DFH27DRAFT_640946 [Peziza echinospora]